MFKKDSERTPQELAQRAVLSTIARLGACGYLIYIMIKLIRQTERKPVTIVIAVVFLAAAAVVITLTLIEMVRGIKNGMYKESTYYTEEYLAKVKAEQEEYRREHPEEFEDEDEYSDGNDDPGELPAPDDDGSDGQE